jgi:hypothetical protein
MALGTMFRFESKEQKSAFKQNLAIIDASTSEVLRCLVDEFNESEAVRKKICQRLGQKERQLQTQSITSGKGRK